MGRRILILFLALAASRAWAREYMLFNADGRPVANYNTVVQELLTRAHPGDVLVFSPKEKFPISRLLGRGGMTAVFELNDHTGHAIRIPLNKGKTTFEFFNEFEEGAEELSKTGVPHVDIHGYRKNQYLVVDALPNSPEKPLFTLYDFLGRRWLDRTPQEAEMKSGLVEFAKRTASLSSIGDFHSKQIAWNADKRQWVLMDWSEYHVPAGSNDAPTVFDKLAEFGAGAGDWQRELFGQIKEAVLRTRLANPSLPSPLSRPVPLPCGGLLGLIMGH